MGAHHHHGEPAGARNTRRLVILLVLTALYMVAEFLGGLAAHSLALMADAVHMLSDVAALGLSLFALVVAHRPPTMQRTYGYYRTEILAALINGAALVAISIFIFHEAYQRFQAPPEVRGGLLMAVAAGGLVLNLAGLVVLRHGRSESLNLRGAWLHMMADALGSLGALVAGGLILAFGWAWADPLVSVLIGLLVIHSSWTLLKEAVAVLMEGVPGHIDVDEVRNVMARTPGVLEVHDLHVWTITTGMESLSGHVVAAADCSHSGLLSALQELLHHRFGIHHVTIQIEPAGFEEHRSPGCGAPPGTL